MVTTASVCRGRLPPQGAASERRFEHHQEHDTPHEHAQDHAASLDLRAASRGPGPAGARGRRRGGHVDEAMDRDRWMLSE